MENIDKKRSYFIKEINQNDLISKKQKKVFTALNYIEHLLVLTSVITRCVLISAFTSFVGIPTGILSCRVGLKIYAITTGIKKYESMIKQNMTNMTK